MQKTPQKEGKRKTWLKYRGYLHLTNKIALHTKDKQKDEQIKEALLKKVKNPLYVKKHAFFPLLHYKDKQRRYKKQFCQETKKYIRSHKELGKNTSTAKIRPIHFATHIDAHIYAYYKDKLCLLYEDKLESNEELNKCVLAYRQIPILHENGKPILKGNGEKIGKSTIHFAKEIFDDITTITNKNGSSVVLTFDVEKFFSSLNHKKLKEVWAGFSPKSKNTDTNCLRDDHYNVFKSVTKFAYIDIEELRKGRGFDEKQLHKIREEGVNAFFKSAEEFRKAIKNRDFLIYKNQFFYEDEVTKKKEPCGIPQGLPISAILANMYMLDFDQAILKFIAQYENTVYRRYSDDILIICNQNNCETIEDEVKRLMELQKLKLSSGKTEKFIFTSENKQITVKKCDKNLEKNLENRPLTYLGFEFYGNKTLIKAANISKFYRRIKQAVNTKKRVIARLKEKHNTENIELYTKDFRKLLSSQKPKKVDKKQIGRKNRQKANDKYGNFPYYVYKASNIFGKKCKKDGEFMLRQIRNRYHFLKKELEKFD